MTVGKKEKKRHCNQGTYTHIQRQTLTTIRVLIPIDTHQRLTVLEQTRFQTDHDELHTRRGMVPDIVRDLADVGIVQCGVNLIEDEER